VDVSTVPATDARAVGDTGQQALILHWNGTT